MNLKRIKCMIVGHEWEVHGFAADVAAARTCSHCEQHIPAVDWSIYRGHVPPCPIPPPPLRQRSGAQINLSPTHPRPPAPKAPPPARARVLGWGISIPEMVRIPPAPTPPALKSTSEPEMARHVIVAPGDLAVFEYPGHLSSAQRKAIMEMITAQLPIGAKAIVLEGGVSLRTVMTSASVASPVAAKVEDGASGAVGKQ